MDENYYLVSPDYSEIIHVEISKDFPFNNFSNDLGVYFEYNDELECWEMKIRNPYLEFENN